MDISTSEVITWAAGGLVTGAVKILHGRLGRIDDKLGAIPEKYVSKTDYRDDVQEIKQTLRDLRGLMEQRIQHNG